MEDLLKNMNPGKRGNLIASSREEFAKRGYQKASTNNIVKRAGVSKGLLFHYFGSKKALYDYLEEYVVALIISELEDKIDWEETDFFNRVKQVVWIKGTLSYRYTYLFEFFTVVLAQKSTEQIYAYQDKYAPGLMQKIYTHNIDYSKFKDDLDMGKAVNIINWVFEKYSTELLAKMSNQGIKFNYEAVEKDFNDYVEILKTAFYK
jgi:AcrR family transcriptional regulator